MKKYTAGDLEQAIQMVWQTSDDLELFFKYSLDAPKAMTEDEYANTILGLKQLHDMRIWYLNDMHCRVFELNQYCTDPAKLAAREEVFNVKPKKKETK
jgi:hypothetical protein